MPKSVAECPHCKKTMRADNLKAHLKRIHNELEQGANVVTDGSETTVGGGLLEDFRDFLEDNTTIDKDTLKTMTFKQLVKQLELRVNLEAIQKEIETSKAPVEPSGAARFLSKMP